MEPQQTITSCYLFVLLSTQRFQQNAIRIFDCEVARQSSLSIYTSQGSHVVSSSTEQVHNCFISKTGSPDGESIALIILFVSVVEYVLDVASPLIIFIDGHFTSWEEHSIDFTQYSVELGSGVVVEQR